MNLKKVAKFVNLAESKRTAKKVNKKLELPCKLEISVVPSICNKTLINGKSEKYNLPFSYKRNKNFKEKQSKISKSDISSNSKFSEKTKHTCSDTLPTVVKLPLPDRRGIAPSSGSAAKTVRPRTGTFTSPGTKPNNNSKNFMKNRKIETPKPKPTPLQPNRTVGSPQPKKFNVNSARDTHKDLLKFKTDNNKIKPNELKTATNVTKDNAATLLKNVNNTNIKSVLLNDVKAGINKLNEITKPILKKEDKKEDEKEVKNEEKREEKNEGMKGNNNDQKKEEKNQTKIEKKNEENTKENKEEKIEEKKEEKKSEKIEVKKEEKKVERKVENNAEKNEEEKEEIKEENKVGMNAVKKEEKRVEENEVKKEEKKVEKAVEKNEFKKEENKPEWKTENKLENNEDQKKEVIKEEVTGDTIKEKKVVNLSNSNYWSIKQIEKELFSVLKVDKIDFKTECLHKHKIPNYPSNPMSCNKLAICPTANNRNSTKSDTKIRVEEEYFESSTDTVVEGKSQKKLTQQKRAVDNTREHGGKNIPTPTLPNAKPLKPLTVSKKVFQPRKAPSPKVYGKNTTTATMSEVKPQKDVTQQIKCHKFITAPKCSKNEVSEKPHPKMHMISKYVAPLGRIFKLDNSAAHIITQSKQAGMWQSYKLSSLDPLSRKVKELIVGEQNTFESKVEGDKVYHKPTTCTVPNSESIFGYSDNFLHKVFQPNVNPFENQCLKLVRLGVDSHPHKRDLHYTHITVDKFPRSSYRPDICTIEKFDPHKSAIFGEEEPLGTLE